MTRNADIEGTDESKEHPWMSLHKRFEELFSKVSSLDLITHNLTNVQAELTRKGLCLLREINWLLTFQGCKSLKPDKSPILKENTGAQLVSVRPCDPFYQDKTFIGFMLGDLATGIGVSASGEGEYEVYPTGHNPAIYIPEIGKIVYGRASFWGRITNENDLVAITDEAIRNTWYVKAAIGLTQEGKMNVIQDDV